jgi:hypothetical protein
MATKLSFWPHRGLGIENGPCVYALGIRTDWSPQQTPKWSSEEFPEWSARPASDWNYGIGAPETLLLEQVELQGSGPSGDPWVNPPRTTLRPIEENTWVEVTFGL